MDNNKILNIVEMRMRNIPYSIIAYKLEESEVAVRNAAASVVKRLKKEKINQHTIDALRKIPYTNVRKYLIDNGLSIKQFSSMCGVSLQYMSMALNNKKGMPVQNALRIAENTGLALHEVYVMDAADVK